MRRLATVVLALGLTGSPPGVREAMAQVPPHAPGSICFTPQFWCWAPQQGPVGALCACPTPYGWVQGRLG